MGRDNEPKILKYHLEVDYDKKEVKEVVSENGAWCAAQDVEYFINELKAKINEQRELIIKLQDPKRG